MKLTIQAGDLYQESKFLLGKTIHPLTSGKVIPFIKSVPNKQLHIFLYPILRADVAMDLITQQKFSSVD